MKSAVHLFDGYVSVEGEVRARCSCGFLTVGQAAQRSARYQLVTSHGLSDLLCEACGLDCTTARLEVGLPASLAIQPDPVAGHHRLVCAQGSGGCDLTSQLGAEAATQVAEATNTMTAGVRDQVAAFQASTIATAVGVLMGRTGVDYEAACERLSAQARHLGISVLEAANRVVAAAATVRCRTRVRTEPTVGTTDEPQPM
ncbi:ANTAR domain-containing protein [Solicola sp. PLA-1-18]|uniref:ANTAR domain-containing protein n=1 Tax=Solicola sp. PLA-1-18 TaxID=3380532 RepID=UPI003B7C644E